MVSQQRGTVTHNRILSTAALLFAEQGYDATGVAEICERAGVTKGAFYHHFPTKQAVFMELLERWLNGLDAQLAVARMAAPTIPEALLRMAEMAGRVFDEARGQLPIFLEFWSKASRDPAVWQATIAPYRRYRDFMEGLIQAGIAEGTLRPVDAEAGAQLLLSVAVGVLLQGLLDPEGADWKQVLKRCFEMVLQGLAKG